jgi:hypothetical protein
MHDYTKIISSGDWRISADERGRYELYFQQCGPIQGYLTGTSLEDNFINHMLFYKVNKRETFLLNQICPEIFFEKYGKIYFDYFNK